MDPSLITKYFSGQCSSTELKQVLDWFQTRKGKAFLRQQIRKDFRRLTQNKQSFRCRDIDTKKVFCRILESIRTDGQPSGKEDTSRINKRLSFEDEPLWMVSKQLETIYDIDIQFQSNQLKKLSLTADFNQNKAEITLQAIASILDIECKKESNNRFVWI